MSHITDSKKLLSEHYELPRGQGRIQVDVTDEMGECIATGGCEFRFEDESPFGIAGGDFWFNSPQETCPITKMKFLKIRRSGKKIPIYNIRECGSTRHLHFVIAGE
jgi:hypothetical protein